MVVTFLFKHSFKGSLRSNIPTHFVALPFIHLILRYAAHKPLSGTFCRLSWYIFCCPSNDFNLDRHGVDFNLNPSRMDLDFNTPRVDLDIDLLSIALACSCVSSSLPSQVIPCCLFNQHYSRWHVPPKHRRQLEIRSRLQHRWNRRNLPVLQRYQRQPLYAN